MLVGLDISKALDVGMGNGKFLEFLKERLKVNKVVGVDISENLVRQAIDRGLEAYKVNVCSEILPFEDDYFDLVFCSEVIEHVFDPDFLLEEIWRVLKTNRHVLITTPNLACWHNRLVLALGFQPNYTSVSPNYYGVGKVLQRPVLHRKERDETSHIRLFTLRAIEELLALHKFRIDMTRGFTGTLPRATRPIDSLFSKIPSLASGLAVRAVKRYAV